MTKRTAKTISTVSRTVPDLTFETKAMNAGHALVAGVDEAGRGPWAGPVVAAAVILDPKSIPVGLNDSKALTPYRRETLFTELKASGALIAVGIADARRIDQMNILQATFWAMQEAISALPQAPSMALIDGNRAPRTKIQTRTIVGGDALCLSISAASIIAKVTRDRIMFDLAHAHPGYGFDKHKGYGTPQHQAALAKLGPCSEHRRSFRPVALAFGGLKIIPG